mmetsp:Transcript_22917/g.63791  ORF Transcript_22917/g.63791 Transcript_22917/m.63791 type:complete len:90 (+) Transcript_22917:1602-1871(+)
MRMEEEEDSILCACFATLLKPPFLTPLYTCTTHTHTHMFHSWQVCPGVYFYATNYNYFYFYVTKPPLGKRKLMNCDTTLLCPKYFPYHY